MKFFVLLSFFFLTHCGHENKICAEGETLFGIDVSKHQGTIDWPKVAEAGVQFTFIRTSDGSTYTDEKFAENWQGAQDNSILRGAYQFFRPREDAIAQANVHLQMLGELEDSDLPSVIDVEVTGDQTAEVIVEKMQQWLDIVSEATGKLPIIYTRAEFWDTNVNSEIFANYPLWIAHYTEECPTLPDAWNTWEFHQYSNTGTVEGIRTEVDLDAFNGDRLQF